MDKKCGPRSDCSSRSSRIWVHTVCYRDVLNCIADDTVSRRYLVAISSQKVKTPKQTINLVSLWYFFLSVIHLVIKVFYVLLSSPDSMSVIMVLYSCIKPMPIAVWSHCQMNENPCSNHLTILKMRHELFAWRYAENVAAQTYHFVDALDLENIASSNDIVMRLWCWRVYSSWYFV